MPGSCAIHCLVPFLLLQAGGTPGDEPAALVRFRQHVLLGDLAAARDLLPEAGAAVDLASRVLLEAATLDAGARAEAMLQICRIYARTPAADTALVAGLAALLDLQDRDWLLADSGLPGRDGPAYDDDRDTVDVVRVAELLAGFQDALETQRQWRGAEEALQDAEWILATAAVARVDRPVRIAAGAFIPVPAPLAEDIEVRFLPWPDDGRCVLEVYRDARGPGSPPRRLAAAVFGQQVEAPPPGEYLLEQRSLASGSTTLRRLLVSDLSLTVEAWEDGIAVLASLGGTPAASANVSIGVDSSGACERRFELSTDEMGLAVVRIPADLRARSMRFDVIADAGGHCARVHDLCLQASEHESSWIEAHVMVDRPLYRPGDTVQGRVVLRRHDLKDDRIHSLPLACAPARLTFWEGSPAEETIEARSDASGVIPFTLPLGQATPLGNASLTLSLTDSNPSSPSADGRKDLDVGTWTPFAVREFRRPFLLVEASGPELARRGEPALVAVRARYPAGPPAAGLAGRIIASVGPLQEQRAFLLDGSGTARAPLHLHELPLPPGEQQVSVRFEVVAPDGQILADSCSFRLEAEEQVAAADDGLQLTLITEEPRAGRPVRIRLAGGLPGRPVLVTHGRLGLLGAARVLLDERGRGEVIIETLPEHWPGIVVRAIQEIPEVLERWRPYWYGTSLSVALAPPAGPLLVELDARARYAPGERAELKLRVSDEQGRGVKATTTVAVVDETVFELEADRTAHPTLSLTPPIDASAALAAHSLGCPSPWLTLGELLRDGAIAPWAVEWYSGAGSGWANPAKAPAAIGALTVGRDFRATALFAASLETDEDGRGSVSFTFPDDLTRWRITVAAIDCGVRGCLRTFATETTLPLSATPILPRLLRQGDELDVSVLLNRQDGTAGPCEVAMRAEGGARVEGVERATVLVAPEEAARTTFRLRAVEARAATTISEVADGSTAHAAVHTLPVLPDLTVRPVSSAVLVERRAELCLPDDLPGPVARRTLELLSGREALLRRAAEYLQGYPHGCVEQVLSRMAPLFAAARARRVSGQGREASLSREQGLALEAGMAHLRGLLADRSTGFRWWPAGPVDERMTALALTALSHARESGIDGTRYGIEVTPDAGELAALAMHAEACGSQVGDREDEVSLDQAELLVACLRYGANLPYFAHAVRALVEEQQALPAGLLARAGLALHCSGSEALAAAVLERILAARDLLQPDWPRGAIPVGEAEAERVAQLLELALTVSPDHPARPRLMERLLRLHGGNSVSTFAAAAAIHTLALDAEFHGGGRESGAVRATIEDDSRTLAVTLDETNGYRVKLPVSAAGRLAVAVDGKQPVVAVLQGEAEAQGSTHVGWRSPLQVERRLLRVETDASGSEHLTDLADADPVHLGDLLEARIEVRCDEPVAYVVVSCPLPAGFEVAGGSGWELRDDHATTTMREVGPSRTSRAVLRLLPAHTGEVAWPPAVAEAMYAPDLCGASRGARLVVTAPRPRAEGASLSPLLSGARLQERIAALLWTLLHTSESSRACNTIRELHALCGNAGPLALLAEGERVATRWLAHPEVLEVFAAATLALPEAQERRRACASKDADPGRSGLALFAARGLRQESDEEHRAALLRLLAAPDVSGLDGEARFNLVCRHLDELATGPFWSAVVDASFRDGVVTCDGEQIPDEVLAWTPLLEILVDRIGARPPRAESDALQSLCEALDPCGTMQGALPGATLAWFEAEKERLRWRLLGKLLTEDGAQQLMRDGPVGLWRDLLTGGRGLPRVAAVLDVWLRAALHTGGERGKEAFCALLGFYPESSELLERVAPALLAALGDPRPEIRAAAADALPDHLLTGIPPALLRAAEDPDCDIDGQAVRRLLSTGIHGSHAVLAWLAERGTCDQPDEVIEVLGASTLAAAPLPALRALAESRELVPVLAASPHTDAALAAELAERREDSWRDVLVEALARRGVASAPFQADDPLAEHYATLLAASCGRADALEVVREWLRSDDVLQQGTDEEQERALSWWERESLARALSPHMDVEEFVLWGHSLDEAEFAAVTARFTQADWRVVLARFDKTPLRAAYVPDHVVAADPLAVLAAATEWDHDLLAPLARAAPATLQDAALRTKDAELARRMASELLWSTGRPALYRAADGSTARLCPADAQEELRALAVRLTREHTSEVAQEFPDEVRTILRRHGLPPPR